MPGEFGQTPRRRGPSDGDAARDGGRAAEADGGLQGGRRVHGKHGEGAGMIAPPFILHHYGIDCSAVVEHSPCILEVMGSTTSFVFAFTWVDSVTGLA